MNMSPLTQVEVSPSRAKERIYLFILNPDLVHKVSKIEIYESPVGLLFEYGWQMYVQLVHCP